jgi:ABC-type transport system substrate-binding protein
MEASYWSNLLTRRISRRRSLAVSGSAGLAAVLSAACGGGGDGSGDPSANDKSGLLSKREDTTSRAKPGGSHVHYRSPESVFIDPHTNSAAAAFGEASPQYSTLLKFGYKLGETPPPDAISGDAAESFEVTPDGTQITLKLRPNHRFDPRPPTNSRALNAADVKWSYERTVALSPNAGDLAYSIRQAGPVESLATTDDRTVLIKMAYPYTPITELLSYWFLYILPVEAEDKFNPRTESRGSGPFRLESWSEDRGFDYVKNPDWYVEDRPCLDQITKLRIPEYATALAQFEAGALWDMSVRQEDILGVKSRHSNMVMLQGMRGGSPGQYTNLFSTREDSQFRDVRLRRAISMMYDREAFLDTFNNVSVFNDAGLPTETFWDSHLASQAFNWIDPRENDDLGEAQEYFQVNLAEAKMLLSATGFSGEIEYKFRNVGDTFPRHAQVMAGMIEQAGLAVRLVPLDHPQWLEHKTSGGKGFSGIYGSTANSYNDDAFLSTKYTPAGRDRVWTDPLPGITDLIVKARGEVDVSKRNEIIKQIQVDLAKLMPDMSLSSTADIRIFLELALVKELRHLLGCRIQRSGIYGACFY